MFDSSELKISGHVLIKDKVNNEIIMDKHNDIHYENMCEALALSLAYRTNGVIDKMVFGNGAAITSGINTITYFPANTTGQTATLYNQTYSQIVNELDPSNTDTVDNYIQVQHSAGNVYTDIVVTCLLDYNSPVGQDALDSSTSTSGTYTFNELGLLSMGSQTSPARLLTHCIFSPIQKSANRQFEIVYTIRIFMT